MIDHEPVSNEVVKDFLRALGMDPNFCFAFEADLNGVTVAYYLADEHGHKYAVMNDKGEREPAAEMAYFPFAERLWAERYAERDAS